MISTEGRALAQVDTDNLAALRAEITRQDRLRASGSSCRRRSWRSAPSAAKLS